MNPMVVSMAAQVVATQATWFKRGRDCSTKASTSVHGLLGAIKRVLDKRDQATRKPLGLTPRQALNRMRKAFP